MSGGFHRVALHPTSMNGVTSIKCIEGEVSIIMRTKDRPILLARAFASVLNQTYENWHLYVVNDGGSPEVLDDLVKQYKSGFGDRLTVIQHEKSKGMEAASNAALQLASGEFVVVHDDDDAWHPKFLKNAVKFLSNPENSRCGAVVSDCVLVYETIERDIVLEQYRAPWNHLKNTVGFLDMLSGNLFPPICLVIRSSVAKSIGSYNATLPVLGDWDYNLRVMMVADIGKINKELAYYHHRVSKESSDVYGNSVRAGESKHHLFGAYYSNSLIRSFVQKDPANIGLMHAIMRRIDNQQHDIINSFRHELSNVQNDLSRIEHSLNHRIYLADERVNDHLGYIEAQLLPAIARFNKALRIPLWFWRRALPVRRVIARLRGRL